MVVGELESISLSFLMKQEKQKKNQNQQQTNKQTHKSLRFPRVNVHLPGTHQSVVCLLTYQMMGTAMLTLKILNVDYKS